MVIDGVINFRQPRRGDISAAYIRAISNEGRRNIEIKRTDNELYARSWKALARIHFHVIASTRRAYRWYWWSWLFDMKISSLARALGMASWIFVTVNRWQSIDDAASKLYFLSKKLFVPFICHGQYRNSSMSVATILSSCNAYCGILFRFSRTAQQNSNNNMKRLKRKPPYRAVAVPRESSSGRSCWHALLKYKINIPSYLVTAAQASERIEAQWAKLRKSMVYIINYKWY